MGSPSISLPGSKSIAARALILKRVFSLDTPLENLPDCDDTRELAAALKIYDRCRHRGHAVIDIGNGGTSLRFFLALAASTPGFEATIDCGGQLRSRPLSPLISALHTAGAEITCTREDMHTPLHVKGKRLNGKDLHVDAAMSSQFASALILASPLWKSQYATSGQCLQQVSRPYIEMSVKMRDLFCKFSRFRTSTPYIIEPDWSAAAFFYEFALLHPGCELRFERLTPPGDSLQGDSATASMFGRLGVGTIYNPDGSATIKGDRTIIERAAQNPMPVQFAMHSTPDLVPAMAIALCLGGIRFTMSGVRNLRFKESDRLEALRCELRKLGFTINVSDDSLSWNGESNPEAAINNGFDSRGDHRIAMALAAAGIPPASIKGYPCISKSFPGFRIPDFSCTPPSLHPAH